MTSYNNHYFHLLIILSLAWGLYAQCQQDFLLPIAAFVVVIASYLLRIKSHEKRYAFMGRVSVVRTFIFSAIGGIIWRIFMPAPEMASAIYLEIISAAQSATIIAAVLFWLKPYSTRNIYWLTAVAWATVALSINVPFDATIILLFRLFCIFSAVNILAHTFKKPPLQKRNALHCRQLLIFGLLLMVATGILFRGIALGIRVFDQVSMSLIGEYLFPRGYTHFLNLSPLLRLSNPGESAFDRRPVLEVDSKGYHSIYLKTQVFENYHDGIWEEAKESKRTPVNNQLLPGLLHVNMLLYKPLKDIIPSPYGLKAVRGRDELLKDINHIVYGKNDRRTRMLSFSLGGGMLPVQIDHESFDQKRYLAVPQSLRQPLMELTAPIISGLSDPNDIAHALQNYFQKNFQYTLNVDFRADEKGVLKMITQKRAAYCTYFATAMTLMLRSAGIPARVVTGFASAEKIGPKKDRILVRVKNAHAWSEALVPFKDIKTNTVILGWLPFDGTPANTMDIVADSGSAINELADKIWLFTLRTLTYIQNVDKDKAKQYSLYGLILLYLLLNIKKIMKRFGRFRIFSKIKVSKSRSAPKEILAIYHRYENYLNETLREKRAREETDAQVLQRLSAREDIPQNTLEKIHAFINQYRRARFGKEESALESYIRTLEEVKK